MRSVVDSSNYFLSLSKRFCGTRDGNHIAGEPWRRMPHAIHSEPDRVNHICSPLEDVRIWKLHYIGIMKKRMETTT